ncbi:TRAP transporter substrate-binding protein [Alkalihalobacterium alkalinitrilicum]|uniref:TRAP transporter substrate-binding protein n=1 Tax=Alkalihalobacterium alkalinitrilicum TaxID=427920 RepID=UPI000995A5B1|nr:TRAP transporter substrate-binding protein DctP [Alkalihalobacterium alkalinitrilicum]
MKKVFLNFTVLMMTILFLAACGQVEDTSSNESTSDSTNDSNNSGETFELNYNVLAPPTHPYTTNVSEPWAEFVHNETDGRVTVHLFPSAALGTPDTGYDDVSGGVFDVGLLYASSDRNDILFPLSIGDLPFAIPNPDVAVNVMNKFYDQFMKDTFEDAVWLGASSTDTAQLYSTDPIETVEDIRNRKISNSLYSRNQLIQLWDAVPVSIANSELYESVERGLVDDIMYNTLGAIGFNLNEVAHYMTKLDLGVSSNGLFINSNAFNQLPEDLQELFIEKLGPKHQELMAELYMTEMENAITEFENRVKDKGGRVIIPDGTELDQFREPAKKMWEDWVDEANKRGYPGDEMMEFFKQALEEEGLELSF